MGLSFLRAQARQVLLLCVLLVSPPLAAVLVPVKSQEARVALVIGNAAYVEGRLRNPANDARAVASRLKELGFDVIVREDLRAADIGRTLSAFRERLRPGAVAVFYYAGHGLQIDGRNYLPAVDARIEVEEDVPQQSLDVARVLDTMSAAGSGLKLLFLDACRNNPYAGRARGASRGLAPVAAPGGTLIQYATRPGAVADDGSGQHGIYTSAFLAEVGAAGVPVEQTLKRIARRVKSDSGGRQEPWFEGNIDGDFYFGGLVAAPLSAESTVKKSQAASRVPNSTIFTDCPDCPVMFLVRAGGFKMGDTHSTRTSAFEQLPHAVDIKKDFLLALTEVTVGEFRQFVMSTGYITDAEFGDERFHGCISEAPDAGLKKNPVGSWRSPGFPQNNSHPVVCVTWGDAIAYLKWLSERSGHEYRLPSEEEFEYALRAGSDSNWPWGESSESACKSENVGDQTLVDSYDLGRTAVHFHPCTDGFTFTSEVQHFAPNAFGLFDMGGNVKEWVQNCSYHSDPIWQTGRAVADPLSTNAGCRSRIVRGGGWSEPVFNTRSSFRMQYLAGLRTNHVVGGSPTNGIGFRVARSFP